MSEVADRFTTEEMLRQEHIKKMLTQTGDAPVESDINNEMLLKAASLYAAFLPTILYDVSKNIAEYGVKKIAPGHDMLQGAVGLIAGLAGTLLGDPAAFEGVSEESAEEVKSALTAQSMEAKIQEAVDQSKERNFKLVQRLLNATGKKELEQKVTFYDKALKAGQSAYSAQVNAELLNPRITGEKAMTDSIFLPIQLAFKGIGTGIEHGPVAGAKVMQAGLYAFKQSFKAALKYGVRSFNEDIPAFQEALGIGKEGVYLADVDNIEAESFPAYGWRWLYSVGRRAVGGADQFAKAMSFYAELHMNAYIEALDEADAHGLIGAAKLHFADAYAAKLANNPSDALMAKTVQNMFRDTFGDNSKTISALSSVTTRIPGARILFPYIRTPANLIKQGMYLSPLAPLTSAFREDIANGGIDQASAYARWAAGAYLWYWTADEVAKGNITGDGPQGRGKEFWPNRLHPRSIKIGNQWYSYAHLGPIAQTISTIADATEMYHLSQDPTTQGKIIDAAERTISLQMDNMPFLGTIHNMMHAMDSLGQGEGKEKAAVEFLSREAEQFLPAPVRIAEQVIDPRERDAKNALEAAGENVPWFSHTIPPKRDAFGHFVYPPVALDNQAHALTKAGRLLNTINPFPTTSDADLDDVDKEIFRLGMSFDKIPDHLTIGTGVDPVGLSEEYQDELARTAGHEPDASGKDLHTMLQDTINLPFYHTLNDPWKKEWLQSIHTGYVEDAKNRLIMNHPELMQQINANTIKAEQDAINPGMTASGSFPQGPQPPIGQLINPGTEMSTGPGAMTTPTVSAPLEKQMPRGYVYSEEYRQKLRTSSTCFCTKCEVWKPREEFSPDSRATSGVDSWCRKCKSINRRQYDTGFSPKEYTNLLEEQKGKCAICKQILGNKLHADHNKRTNQKRGLLCGKCNRGIGMFDDSIDILISAIEYLKKWNGD